MASNVAAPALGAAKRPRVPEPAVTENDELVLVADAAKGKPETIKSIRNTIRGLERFLLKDLPLELRTEKTVALKALRTKLEWRLAALAQNPDTPPSEMPSETIAVVDAELIQEVEAAAAAARTRLIPDTLAAAAALVVASNQEAPLPPRLAAAAAKFALAASNRRKHREAIEAALVRQAAAAKQAAADIGVSVIITAPKAVAVAPISDHDSDSGNEAEDAQPPSTKAVVRPAAKATKAAPPPPSAAPIQAAAKPGAAEKSRAALLAAAAIARREALASHQARAVALSSSAAPSHAHSSSLAQPAAAVQEEEDGDMEVVPVVERPAVDSRKPKGPRKGHAPAEAAVAAIAIRSEKPKSSDK
jgi:hypothetical protein